MKTTRLKFNRRDADATAERLFIQSCGITADQKIHQKMYAEGISVLEQGIHGIRLEAVVAALGSASFQQGCVTCGDMVFACRPFGRIAEDNVVNAYVYMITGGQCECDQSEPISRQLFADLWGTAYVDAGRLLLADWLRGYEPEGFLSSAFGPGFYGMPMTENLKIQALLDGSQIGIEVKRTGVMLPLKSCAGIYLAVKDPSQLPVERCAQCLGSSKSCALCKWARQEAGQRVKTERESGNEHGSPIHASESKVERRKGAVAAGNRGLLLEEAGITVKQLEAVYLARTFGSHLNIESAVRTGLIPDVTREKIHFIGNAASTGASMALLSQEARKQSEDLAQQIQHLELSSCGSFQEHYLKAMAFQ